MCAVERDTPRHNEDAERENASRRRAGSGKSGLDGVGRRLTIQGHHRALPGGVDPRLLHRVLEVRDELVDDRRGETLCTKDAS